MATDAKTGVDSEQYHQIMYFCTFLDVEKYQLQSNESNNIYLSALISLRSLCIPSVNIIPHGGQTTESLLACNYERRGLKAQRGSFHKAAMLNVDIPGPT